jgi:hypothetical protein
MSDRLPTTADTTVENTCSSRMLDVDALGGPRILHCDPREHVKWHDGKVRHYAPGWQWSDAGAMPDDRPCDRRCARCVERTRDAVLDAAIAWYDMGDNQLCANREAADDRLIQAIYEYRKVTGR